MAPCPPVGKQAVLAALRSDKPKAQCPILLGSPHPVVAVVYEPNGLLRGGTWAIRELVVDMQELEAIRKRQEKLGQGFYPEHRDQASRPTGATHLSAQTLEEFIIAIEAMSWPPHW